MSSATRTVFYRELGSSLSSRSRYLSFAAFFAISSAFFCTSLQLGEGRFWTLQALWTISVAVPLPILVSLVTMPLFAGERAAGTYESLAMLPIPMRKFIVGKFIAAFLSTCVAIAGSLVPWLLLSHTLKSHAPAFSTISAPCVILLLQAFSWTALGTLSSAISRRPWLAAVGTIISGGALMLAWAAVAHFWLSGNLFSSTYPIFREILDAAGGHVSLSSFAFHVAFGLLCLFAATRVLEANR